MIGSDITTRGTRHPPVPPARMLPAQITGPPKSARPRGAGSRYGGRMSDAPSAQNITIRAPEDYAEIGARFKAAVAAMRLAHSNEYIGRILAGGPIPEDIERILPDGPTPDDPNLR